MLYARNAYQSYPPPVVYIPDQYTIGILMNNEPGLR